MSDNYFADWTSQADEERRRRALAALATSSDEGPHRTLANQVQLPEMDIVGDPQPPAAPSYDRTPPEPDLTPGTDAQASPEMPPDAPPLARLGSALKQRDGYQDAPAAPARSESSDRGGDGKTTWTGTALAALADILLNHGRGVGGVLALGAAGQSPMAKAELDLKRAQAEHLRNPTSDPAAMAYKQAQLDLMREREQRIQTQGDSHIDLQRTNIGNTQARFDKRNADASDPNSQLNRTKVLLAGQTAGAGAEGRINAEHGLNDVVTGDKAQVAGAEAAARIGAGHDLAPVTTADEAAKARAVGYAGNEPKLAYEQSMNPVLADRTNNGIGAGLSVEGLIQDNPGLEFSDPEQVRRAMKTRTINAQTLDKLQASNRAREILDSMYKTISDFQSGDKSPESYYGASKQLDSHAQEYAGMMGRISGAQNQEQVRADAARVPSLLNPYALTGVKKLWEAADANIKGNLGTLGIHARAPSFGQQPTDAEGTPGTKAIDTTNPTPSASPAKGDYANYSGGSAKDPLPTTAGRPAPIPGAEQRNRHVVHTPNGDEVGDLTQDEVMAFRRKGLRVD